MRPIHERLVRALSLFLLLALVISGCGGSLPTGPPKPKPKPCMPGELTRDDGTCQPAGLPPDMPCPPGELARDDGTCQPAGLPPDMPCPPGELAVNGGCQPAGVPPSACGKGFMPDGKQGCEPILPAAPCPAGQMAVPGETACHEVAFCGHGTWGSIPVDADTQFVDKAYAGGGSDGTKAKPWTTIQQGINAAKQGAIVAVAAGKYAQNVSIQGKAVRLWGRCPALVEVSGSTPTIKVLGQATGATEIRDLAVTGTGLAIAVKSASGVVLDRVWVHDTGDHGLEILDGSSPTSVSLTGSLFEHTSGVGVFVWGADATLEATVVRDTLPDADGMFGRGIDIDDAPSTQTRANVTVRACVVEHNRQVGVYVLGSDATLEATVVRDTLPGADGMYGWGIGAQDDLVTKARANVTVRACVVEKNRDLGVFVQGSDVTLEATVVRDTVPGEHHGGTGISIEVNVTTSARANVTIQACLVEQNHMIGVYVEGSDATVSATVVRDTMPDASGDFGRGVDIEYHASSEERANVAVRGCLVEHNRERGVFVQGSDVILEASVVRGTMLDANGDVGAGVSVRDAETATARANVIIHACLVEQNHRVGVLVWGSDVTLSASVVRDTMPDGHGKGGYGIEFTGDQLKMARASVTIDACLVEENQSAGVWGGDSDVIVRSSVVAQNVGAGIATDGANATIEATALRDTLLDAMTMTGRGLDIQSSDASKLRSSAIVHACLVEHNHEIGVFVAGSDATIEATVIRSNASDEQASDRAGIVIQDDPALMERSNTTLRGCLVEENQDFGVAIVGSDVTVEASVVQGTLPDAHGSNGRGIWIQENLDTEARSSVTVRACLVQQNRIMGLGVRRSDATIEDTTVQGTEPDGDGKAGDGLTASLSTLRIQGSEVTNNARAGIANFGSAVVISSSTLTCNAFDLEGESLPEADFSFDGSTGWQCSLQRDADCNKFGACHVETAGIEAPTFDLPPIDSLPPPAHTKP